MSQLWLPAASGSTCLLLVSFLIFGILGSSKMSILLGGGFKGCLTVTAFEPAFKLQLRGFEDESVGAKLLEFPLNLGISSNFEPFLLRVAIFCV